MQPEAFARFASGTGNKGRSALAGAVTAAAADDEVPLDPCTLASAGGGPGGTATRGSEEALKVPAFVAGREALRKMAAMSSGRGIPVGGIAKP